MVHCRVVRHLAVDRDVPAVEHRVGPTVPVEHQRIRRHPDPYQDVVEQGNPARHEFRGRVCGIDVGVTLTI